MYSIANAKKQRSQQRQTTVKNSESQNEIGSLDQCQSPNPSKSLDLFRPSESSVEGIMSSSSPLPLPPLSGPISNLSINLSAESDSSLHFDEDPVQFVQLNDTLDYNDVTSVTNGSIDSTRGLAQKKDGTSDDTQSCSTPIKPPYTPNLESKKKGFFNRSFSEIQDAIVDTKRRASRKDKDKKEKMKGSDIEIEVEKASHSFKDNEYDSENDGLAAGDTTRSDSKSSLPLPGTTSQRFDIKGSKSLSFSSGSRSPKNEEPSRSKRFSTIFGDECPGEVGVQDYVAALSRHKMSFQGRVYLSDKSLCFFSHFCKKNYILRFDQIVHMTKKKWAGLPTGLRISLESGQSYTFHSMVSRNECFNDIKNLWAAYNDKPISALINLENDDETDADAESVGSQGDGSRQDSSNMDDDCEDVPEVPCDCPQHYERPVINQVYNVSANRLFTLLFSKDSEFKKSYNELSNITNAVVPPWESLEPSEDGWIKQKREVTFTMPLKKNPIGPKVADVIDVQLLSRRDNKVFVISCESCTPKLPYGDNMVIRNKFCITHAGSKQSRLVITSEIAFKKSIMGPVKYAIVKSSIGMIEESHATLTKSLKDYLSGDLLSTSKPSTPTTVNAAARINATKTPESDTMDFITALGLNTTSLVVVLLVFVSMILLLIGYYLASILASVNELSAILRDLSVAVNQNGSASPAIATVKAALKNEL